MRTNSVIGSTRSLTRRIVNLPRKIYSVTWRTNTVIGVQHTFLAVQIINYLKQRNMLSYLLIWLFGVQLHYLAYNIRFSPYKHKYRVNHNIAKLALDGYYHVDCT